MRKVYPITRTDVDLQFDYPITHVAAISKIAECNPVNALQDGRFRDNVFQLSEPCSKGIATVLVLIVFNFEHWDIVTYKSLK